MAMATMRPPMKSMQEDFMKYMLVWAVVIIPQKKIAYHSDCIKYMLF